VREAAERFRAALPVGKTAREYLDLAAAHHRAGRHVEAKEALFQVRRMDPANAEAGNRMGRLALDMGLPDLALGALRQAVAMAPQCFQYRLDLGDALATAGRHEDAERVYRSALQLNPDSPLALSALGLTLARLGRADEGLEACRRAARMNGHLAAVHTRLGQVLESLGRADETRDEHRAAASIAATTPGAAPTTPP